MNRLVIIGNGFDLAHGLATSYNDFMTDFWSNLCIKYSDSGVCELIFINPEFYRLLNYGNNEVTSFSTFKSSVEDYFREYSVTGIDSRDVLDFLKGKSSSLRGVDEYNRKPFELVSFNNDLWRILNRHHEINNWVDIEQFYYDTLVSITKGNVQFREYKGNVIKLNKEFQQIKSLFEAYLNRVLEKYDWSAVSNSDDVVQFFNLNESTFADLDFLNEFSISYQDKLRIEKFANLPDLSVSQLDKSYIAKKYENLLLDFNYTPTSFLYEKALNENYYSAPTKTIKIHGELNSDQNKIIFGFGDELDEDYKNIEKKGNEYLEQFKSFQYFNTNNYRRLLNWVDSKDYQIFIFGHSCGLSDRILLNHIFENPNCKSIKIFYHKRADDTDNFTEITKNISRHFSSNNKGLMREKIVDKFHSKCLPQGMKLK
tara:strand:+ start:9935 stop:11215 length:1281 start_codon:yes stop_codon:yes gene_type:complete